MNKWGATMSTAISAHPADVNAKASMVAETTREFISRVQNVTGFVLLSLIHWDGNRRICAELRKLRKLVSGLTIENDGERAKLRKSVSRLQQCVSSLERVHGEWVSQVVPRIPSYIPWGDWLGSAIARQLEELVCTTEDIAETLELAADGEFARAVRRELTDAGLASAQDHETV